MVINHEDIIHIALGCTTTRLAAVAVIGIHFGPADDTKMKHICLLNINIY